jgi:hypothetical protein
MRESYEQSQRQAQRWAQPALSVPYELLPIELVAALWSDGMLALRRPRLPVTWLGRGLWVMTLPAPRTPIRRRGAA